MTQSLQIAVWNANGLSRHRHEVQMFLLSHNIDVLLISDTHFTTKSYFHLPHYTIYHTNHPSGSTRGGSAVIIKNSIKHNLLNPHSQKYLQATSIALEGPSGHITISAVYLPPKHTITHSRTPLNIFLLSRTQIPGRWRLQCQMHNLGLPT
jgi:exonuclease III